jgi:chromosome segregation ATPase
MAIKEILDRIKAKLGADDTEARALLADAEREVNDILDSKQSADKESKQRKEKIRDLESQLDAKTAEIEKLSSQDNKAELDRLRKVEAEYQTKLKTEDDALATAWADKAKVFELPETDKRHSKINALKGKFQFGTEDSPLAIDAIKSNMEKFELLRETGIFDDVTPAPATGNPPVTPTATPATPQTSGAAIAQMLYPNKK